MAANRPDPMWIGPYRVVAVLGEGGTGRVFLTAGPSGRLFAVKRALPALAADGGFRARFAAETEAARHASGIWTPVVAHADMDAEIPWAAYKFIPGPTIAHLAETSAALPETAAIRIGAELAAAVDDLLRRGLPVPEVKPAHVVLASDGVRLLYGTAAREHTVPEAMHAIGSLIASAASGGAPDLAAAPVRVSALVAPYLDPDPAKRPGPLRLLEDAGHVEPATRPWPRAVNDLASTQAAMLHRIIPAPQLRTTRLDLDETMIAETLEDLKSARRREPP